MSAAACIAVGLAGLLAQLPEGFGGLEPAPRPGLGGELPTTEHADRAKAAMLRRVAEDKVKSQFLRKKEVSILDGVRDLDRRLGAARRTLRQLERQEAGLVERIAAADAAHAACQARLGALRAALGRRAGAMLRLKRTPLSDLLARAGADRDLTRRLRDALARVLRADGELVRATRADTAEAERLASAMRADRAALVEAQAATEAAMTESLALREERQALLAAVKKERGLLDRLRAEIAQAARRLEREASVVRGLIPPPPRAPGGFGRQRGRLPWPVVGRVEVPFGKRVDPDSGLILDHPGVDVRAPFGVAVTAPFAGRVAFAGAVEGFGRVVVLDHGDRWYSIYGHLDALLVPEAVELRTGEPLGTVGDSGSDKGAYLYLELRQGVRPVDPLSWLAP